MGSTSKNLRFERTWKSAFFACVELLAAKAQARQLLPLLGDLLAAGRELLGLLVDLLLQDAARLLGLRALRLLLPDAGPDAALIQALPQRRPRRSPCWQRGQQRWRDLACAAAR
eukprot:6203517-Pleurochrysis_carterae.AAC.2